jgi:hypothetical protein
MLQQKNPAAVLAAQHSSSAASAVVFTMQQWQFPLMQMTLNKQQQLLQHNHCMRQHAEAYGCIWDFATRKTEQLHFAHP